MRILEYVHEREGEFYVGATRVTLRSIIADLKRGRIPEEIVSDFPSVALVEAYGAITTYLERQQDFDAHFRAVDEAAAQARAATEAAHAGFYADMRSRVAQVRPNVEAELRAHGILGNDLDTATEPQGQHPTDVPPKAPNT